MILDGVWRGSERWRREMFGVVVRVLYVDRVEEDMEVVAGKV